MTKQKTSQPSIMRAAIYVRESSKDQDKGFSPQNQETQMCLYAKEHQMVVAAKYKDLITGTSTQKRDSFKQMLADALERKFDVILVFHTSRFARNVREARHYKDLLRSTYNIDVISVTQKFGDWKDPNAFLNESINEVFDELLSRQISFWTKSGLTEKRTQGRSIGNPPYGYYKEKIGYDEEKQRPIYRRQWLVQPEESKYLLKIVHMYIKGTYSCADLADYLNQHGQKTKVGKSFDGDSVKDILKNRTYLGLIHSPRRGLVEVKGDHPALIPQKLFDAVRAMMKKRSKNIGRPPAQHRFYLLQSLIHCAACYKNDDLSTAKMYCRSKIYPHLKHEIPMYSCRLRKHVRSCKTPDTKCTILDKQVLLFMEGLRLPDDVIQLTLTELQQLLQTTESTEDTAAPINHLERKKEKLDFKFMNTDELTKEAYLDELSKLNDEIARLEGLNELRGNTTKAKEFLRKVEHFLRDFKTYFTTSLSEQEKRAWVQLVIKRVWVKNRKVVAIEPHDDYKPLFVWVQKSGANPRRSPNRPFIITFSRALVV